MVTKSIKKQGKKTSVPKRRSRKASLSRPLERDVPSDKFFWVCNGATLKNLRDLYHELDSMSDAEFEYHTGKGRNDFSQWILDVIGNHECARRTQRARTKDGTRRIIKAYLTSS